MTRIRHPLQQGSRLSPLDPLFEMVDDMADSAWADTVPAEAEVSDSDWAAFCAAVEGKQHDNGS